MAVWSGLKAVSCGKKVRTLGAENSVISDQTLLWFLNIKSMWDNWALITSVTREGLSKKGSYLHCWGSLPPGFRRLNFRNVWCRDPQSWSNIVNVILLFSLEFRLNPEAKAKTPSRALALTHSFSLHLSTEKEASAEPNYHLGRLCDLKNTTGGISVVISRCNNHFVQAPLRINPPPFNEGKTRTCASSEHQTLRVWLMLRRLLSIFYDPEGLLRRSSSPQTEGRQPENGSKPQATKGKTFHKSANTAHSHIIASSLHFSIRSAPTGPSKPR